jgi:glycosyltransferase involved in cell wall biosynthesis
MKILMLTALTARVGTWFRTFNLALALVRRGHRVTVVKVAEDRRIVPRASTEQGVTVYEAPRLWGSSLVFHRGSRMPHDIAARVALQMLPGYDVVHAFTHHLSALLPAAIGRRLPRSTVVVGDRDDLWTDGGLSGDGRAGAWLQRLDHRFNAWTERSMGRWLGAMTVVSEDLRQRELAAGLDPRRLRKIVNGCPVDQIAPGDKARARAALDLPLDRRVALFVGVGQYDVYLIFEALARLKSDHPELPMPLTLLAGPHGRALRQMAQERGIGDAVRATDDMISGQQLAVYLHAADVGLLPFADKPLNRARWPIKLGDYLAAGLPVLTNAVGEMGRLVAEEQVGEVTAPDPRAYADGLARLLADEPRLRALSGRARAAAERLSWDAVGEELERFYLELGAPDGRIGRP